MEKNSTGDSGTSWEEIPISAEKKSIFPKRRLLIVGRRQILAFLVLPIIVLIVFLSVFRLEGVPTNGKGLSQIVFNNGTIDTNTVLAVPFLSGSETEFQELINVSFHYQSNQDGEACDKNSIKVSGSTTSTDALVIDSLKRCFPETIASLAKELHFDILIYKSPFRVPGFTALAIWKGSTNSPIPMVEVGYRVNVEEIAFANLSPSNNPIFGGSNKKVLVFIAVVNAFLAIVQLYNGFQRLVSQQQPLVCNIRVSVCCLQIVSALLRGIFVSP